MDKSTLKHDTPSVVAPKELPKIALPVIVEGRYDKSTLKSVFDCKVIVTDGFGIFNSKEKQALIRQVASRGGVIVLTDSDGGGKQIRSFLSGILPPALVHQLYIPQIEGKEKRKTSPSKAGLLGVEGMTPEVLRRVFDKYVIKDGSSDFDDFLPDTAELFSLGLTGGESSSERRDALAKRLGLPCGMTAKAMASAIPMVLTKAEWECIKAEFYA